MNIAIAGGTGVAGRSTVREAQARGHEVQVLARSTGCDLFEARNLAERLRGVDAVIDLTSTKARTARGARTFFDRVTRNLLGAGAESGVQHHIALSIVGAAQMPVGYYRAKVHQESLVEASAVPWSILATTQFHEFAEQVLDFASVGRRSWVPTMRIAPVAVAEVAQALVDAVEQGPGGRLAPIVGPEQHSLVDLARRVNHRRSLGRRVHALAVPGAAGRAMRSGVLTDAPGARTASTTFDQWL
jgi:uncharacterized protein YbjT (DUF2867 family)